MSYQVLARKYRPQSFDQMIGQNHISQTLLNSLKNNRIPHALLFTGLRGTGKTSSARILAKTLRCTNPVNFSPCHKCDSCLEITKGSAIDVIEIDGASNNGVDAIRDLRDSVMFMPTSGKYKIFIIDEVHMLSISAFNALLKTLEEPPAHVIFMMATTEVHKIPQTILSRCQRFDLRRIPLKQITAHLKKICDLENIKAEEKALWMIAKQGDGSARDSLSLLDQVINFSSGQLTEVAVSEILGLTDRYLIFSVFASLLERNSQKIVSDLEKLHQIGVSPNLFLEDLVQLIRHTLLLKTAPENDTLIDLPIEEIATLKDYANAQSESDLHILFDMALKSLTDLHKSNDPYLVFEVCLLRMSQAPLFVDIQKVITQRPKPLEEQSESPPKTTALFSISKPTTKHLPNAESWGLFVQDVKQQDAFLGAKLDNAVFAGLNNNLLQLQVPPQFAFLGEQFMQTETQEKIQGSIDSFFGAGYAFQVLKTKVATGESSLSLNLKKEKESEAKIDSEFLSEVLKDPRLQKAQQVFKAQAKIIHHKE